MGCAERSGSGSMTASPATEAGLKSMTAAERKMRPLASGVLERRRAYDRARYHKNRDKEKERARLREHKKLPKPTRPCPQLCELCGRPPGKRALALDHDHQTNRFRGWLCGNCNMILGRFGDDAAGLLKAVRYVTRNTELDAATRKTHPLATGCLDYFPDALMAVANCSYVGNQQHNPNQPLHWAKEKSTDEPDALLRHLKDRGKLDSDGVRHSAKVAWRALAMLQREIEAERGL